MSNQKWERNRLGGSVLFSFSFVSLLSFTVLSFTLMSCGKSDSVILDSQVKALSAFDNMPRGECFGANKVITAKPGMQIVNLVMPEADFQLIADRKTRNGTDGATGKKIEREATIEIWSSTGKTYTGRASLNARGYSSSGHPKPSWHVNFKKSDGTDKPTLEFYNESPFGLKDSRYSWDAASKVGKLAKVDEFDLIGSWIDSTYMRNKTVLNRVRAAGGLAPLAGFANVCLNGKWFGFFPMVESVGDEGFFKARTALVAEGGTLFKGKRYMEGNNYWKWQPVTDVNFLKKIFEAKKYDDKLGSPDLMQLNELFTSWSTSTPKIHKADFQSYNMVRSHFSDIDTFGNNNNFYLYREPNGVWRIISWDADASFGFEYNGYYDLGWVYANTIYREFKERGNMGGSPHHVFINPDYVNEYRRQVQSGVLATDMVKAMIAQNFKFIQQDAERDFAAWAKQIGGERDRNKTSIVGDFNHLNEYLDGRRGIP